jgi:c-di-GMP-binding flagellar brake protein YcgR
METRTLFLPPNAALRIARFLLAGLLLAVLFLSTASGANSREERVRKFQTSLGEQVVRDSGGELPDEEKRGVLLRAAALAGAGIAFLVIVSVVLSRWKARKVEADTTLRYLTENLLTPVAVRDHLRRVTAARTPLYLWIDDHFIKFSSNAEGMAPREEGFIVLPVTPATGNDILRRSRRARVEYLHQKVPYHFETAWRNENGDRGSFVHVLHLPARIEFTQRREHFRVEPTIAEPVQFRAMNRDLPSMSVLDLGMWGFSVATSARLRPGEEIAECRIDGGGTLPLDLSARCVYEFAFPENTSKFRYRYGFVITRFAEGNAKRLSRFIASREISDLSRRKAMES